MQTIQYSVGSNSFDIEHDGTQYKVTLFEPGKQPKHIGNYKHWYKVLAAMRFHKGEGAVKITGGKHGR